MVKEGHKLAGTLSFYQHPSANLTCLGSQPHPTGSHPLSTLTPKQREVVVWEHWAPSSQVPLRLNSSFNYKFQGGMLFLRSPSSYSIARCTLFPLHAPASFPNKEDKSVWNIWPAPFPSAKREFSHPSEFLLQHVALRTFPCLLLGLFTIFHRNKKTISLFSLLAQPTRNSWQLCKWLH